MIAKAIPSEAARMILILNDSGELVGPEVIESVVDYLNAVFSDQSQNLPPHPKDMQ